MKVSFVLCISPVWAWMVMFTNTSDGLLVCISLWVYSVALTAPLRLDSFRKRGWFLSHSPRGWKVQGLASAWLLVRGSCGFNSKQKARESTGAGRRDQTAGRLLCAKAFSGMNAVLPESREMIRIYSWGPPPLTPPNTPHGRIKPWQKFWRPQTILKLQCVQVWPSLWFKCHEVVSLCSESGFRASKNS